MFVRWHPRPDMMWDWPHSVFWSNWVELNVPIWPEKLHWNLWKCPSLKNQIMTLEKNRNDWEWELVSTSCRPAGPKFARRFHVRLRECRVWRGGSRSLASQGWRLSVVGAASFSPWGRVLPCPSVLESTTPSSSFSGQLLWRSNREGLHPIVLAQAILFWHNTPGSSQETAGNHCWKSLYWTAYHRHGSCISVALPTPETILGEISEVAHFQTRVGGELMLFVAKFCLGAWCQDVAEAKRGNCSGVIAVSTKISEKL